LPTQTHIEQARQSLKNYGLSRCILAPFNERSALEKDIALSANAYSFMGKGMHTILQNEDTLQVLHDPYKETENYVLTAYEQTPSNSKYSDEKVVFHACLQVYNSEAFTALSTLRMLTSLLIPSKSKDRSLRQLLQGERYSGVGAAAGSGRVRTIF
jgi:hypothetical protein